jgi:hypothetical protein
VREILYGGARGGGKTDGVLGRVGVRAGLYGHAYSALIVRREMPQADDMLERARELWGHVAQYRETDATFRFSNGARVRFRPLLHVSDAEKYQGQNITDLVIEEAGNYPDPAPVLRLYGALRSGAGIPVSMVLTGNPGGPGQHWLAARFDILRYPEGYRVQDGRVFIPARVKDNALLLLKDPGYVDRLKLVGNAELVRAWLQGDWNAIAGAFFSDWDTARHVVRPFALPDHWLRFRSLDWGHARPSSVGWWAVVSDDMSLPGGQVLPRGCLVRYRELYTATEPNKGTGWVAERLADEIAAMTGEERISYTVADPATFAHDGGPSIAERLGGRGIHSRPADNKRVGARGAMGGWDLMRSRLVGDTDGRAMVVTFITCRDSIRTIPMLQHDEHRPEDLDTDGEDHAADEWRYACASRPWVREAPVVRDPIKEAAAPKTMAQMFGHLADLQVTERPRI